MLKTPVVVLFLLCTTSIAHAFSGADSLDQCEQQNLSQWQSPLRDLLEESSVQITTVFYCQEHPVISARFPYDPLSDQTSSYFHSLFIKLLEANKMQAYSLISDGINVINISFEDDAVSLDYDEINPEPPLGLGQPLQVAEDCFSFPTGSVSLEEGQPGFFKDQYCQRPSKVRPLIDGHVSALIGWKMNYLIFQEGTDANAQTLLIVDMFSLKRIASLDFVGDWRNGGSEILFYQPLGRDAKAGECPNQAEDIAEWKGEQMAIGIAKEYRFDLLTQKTSELQQNYCFPVQ
jgi:hypothetical protein